MNYIVQYAFILVIVNSALASKCGCRRKPVPEPSAKSTTTTTTTEATTTTTTTEPTTTTTTEMTTTTTEPTATTTTVECPLFQQDNQCNAGFHLDADDNCAIDCSANLGGNTYQQYIGIDVVCEFSFDFTAPDLDFCKADCTGDTTCLSGSFNSETGLCLSHSCDPLGESSLDDPNDFIEFIIDAGPCITYFVKNCPP